MAKVVLKKTATEAVVKMTGAATHAIALTTDLATAAQSAPGTPIVNLKRMDISCPTGGTVKISRNSTLSWSFAGPWAGSIQLDYCADTENNTSDFSVVIVGEATCILTLIKAGGYGDEQHKLYPGS